MAFLDFGPIIGDLVAGYALIATYPRFIDTIIPDVTIEEIHHDELITTDHPVEIGAAITDHAFKRPAELEMRVGFSNSTAQAEGYVQAVYQALLDLQSSRIPFNVSTGKRLYSNMLIRNISVTTTQETEFVLAVTVDMKEILLTSVSSTGGVDSSGNQVYPQQTSPTVNSGGQPASAAGANAPSDPAAVSSAGVPSPPIPAQFNTGF
jgi:hypothetical protein